MVGLSNASAATALFLVSVIHRASAFSLSMTGETNSVGVEPLNRRSFFAASVSVATVAGVTLLQPSNALAAKEIITAPSGIKYAVLQEPSAKKPSVPLAGDIVAVEYTGYLTNGQIFDASHAAGKNAPLMFKLGAGSVIPGLDDITSRMAVGQKVQAIVPPELAFGDKGVCLEDGECLIKPGSTLVYDVYLKMSSIPPP